MKPDKTISRNIMSSLITCLLIALASLCGAQDKSTIEESDYIRLATGDSSEKQVNTFSRFARSAIVPGWGEISMKSGAGYAFLGIEILLWAGKFYCREHIDLHERDAYLYALQNAGLKPGDYDKEFLHKLTRYNSSGFSAGGYNEHIFKQARNIYPDDPDKQDEYIQENAILDDDLAWEWGDRDQRRQYSIKRKNADHFRDYVKLVTGVIVANHIISAINSVRIANQINRNNRVNVSIDFANPQTPLATIEYKF